MLLFVTDLNNYVYCIKVSSPLNSNVNLISHVNFLSIYKCRHFTNIRRSQPYNQRLGLHFIRRSSIASFERSFCFRADQLQMQTDRLRSNDHQQHDLRFNSRLWHRCLSRWQWRLVICLLLIFRKLYYYFGVALKETEVRSSKTFSKNQTLCVPFPNSSQIHFSANNFVRTCSSSSLILLVLSNTGLLGNGTTFLCWDLTAKKVVKFRPSSST